MIPDEPKAEPVKEEPRTMNRRERRAAASQARKKRAAGRNRNAKARTPHARCDHP